MSFFSWLRNSKSSRGARGRSQRRSAARRFRPQLEALEDRCLPSTLTVTNNLDSGAGSLRADIAAAKNNDTIVFAPSLDGQTITLTSGVLDINKSLKIQGPGAGQLAVSGNGSSRVFKVEANDQVSLSGLTISNGWTTSDGGGIVNYGNLTVSACTVSNNSAGGGGSGGGGIANEFGAILTVTGSTLSGNFSGEFGGGISNYYGTLTVSGSTLTLNKAHFYGGGIWNGGTATVSSSTISDNTARGGDGTGFGGGIYNGESSSMSLVGSTVTGNSADGTGAGIYDNGYLAISNKSVVCNNFVYSSTLYESDLAIGYFGHVKISGGSKVC